MISGRHRARRLIGPAILLLAGVGETHAQATASLPPIVRGLDHFFATSSNPEQLYRFFRDSLGLPEVYPFRNYDGFASGIVSMGNTLFEVVTWSVPTGQTLPTEFKGLAFEPEGNVDQSISRIVAAGFPPQKPDTVMYTDSTGVRRIGYVNIPLDGPSGLLPTMGSIFINDNLGSTGAARRRRSGADSLAARGGGPLGVVSVREIVIAVGDPGTAVAQWRRLGGSVSGESVRFAVGPALRFVRSPNESIVEMVVEVRSLQRARVFLESRGLSHAEGSHLYVKPAAVDGLRMRLVENATDR